MRKISGVLILLIILGGLSACSFEEQGQSTYYMIDPRFSELYEKLQGKKVLGPPISNKKFVAETNQEKQYFEGGVLVYDPDASPSYYLHPVGSEAGFSDIPNHDPENPAVRYLNGFIIPVEFAKMFDELGGERWVGKPLTRARYNPDKKTVEQYFQNLGFFRYEDDPPGVVHFMPYGLWKCAGECALYPGVDNASPGRANEASIGAVFSETASHLGQEFTGKPISKPYLRDDGVQEQVFENVVLISDSSSPFGANLRPIAVELDHQQPNLVKPKAESSDYFREIQNGKGYYIPVYFLNFIDRYAGFELSGEPIAPYQEIRSGVIRQCFENYCLMYDSKAPEGQRVVMDKLGQKFSALHRTAAVQNSPSLVSERKFQVDVWEQSPQISSSEIQQFGACLHEGEQALSGVSAVLKLSVPGRETLTYSFNPTDNGGCSFLEIDPILEQNGTTVDYQVCFLGISDQNLCQKDSFLIWGNTEPPQENQGLEQNSREDEVSVDSKEQLSDRLSFDVWELKSQISSQEKQEVGACIHQNNQPLDGLKSELKINTPNEGVIFYQSSPSDQGGCSFFSLEPVAARNGETIPYQVCFFRENGEKVCQRDSFLIWGNP